MEVLRSRFVQVLLLFAVGIVTGVLFEVARPVPRVDALTENLSFVQAQLSLTNTHLMRIAQLLHAQRVPAVPGPLTCVYESGGWRVCGAADAMHEPELSGASAK